MKSATFLNVLRSLIADCLTYQALPLTLSPVMGLNHICKNLFGTAKIPDAAAQQQDDQP